MANEQFIWTKIMTYHRSMFHIVEAVSSFFALILIGGIIKEEGIVGIVLNPLFIFSFVSCAIGSFLLHAIVKKNRREIVIYLVICALILAVKHGYLLYRVIRLSQNYYNAWGTFLFSSFVCTFCIYDYLMFYFVVKFGRTLEDLQDPSASLQRNDEPVEQKA